jgi:hypothetical protein
MEAAHASKALELESALSEVASANQRAEEALLETQSLRQALDEFTHGKIVEVSPNGKNRKVYAAKATIESRGGDDDDDDDEERSSFNMSHHYHRDSSSTSTSTKTSTAASNALLQATRAALEAAEERADIATREAAVVQAAIVEAESIAADAVRIYLRVFHSILEMRTAAAAVITLVCLAPNIEKRAAAITFTFCSREYLLRAHTPPHFVHLVAHQIFYTSIHFCTCYSNYCR